MSAAFEQELATAREAVRAAGKLCLHIRAEMADEAGGIEAVDTLHKAGQEPVTVADYSAEMVIHAHFSRAFPAYGAISEEDAHNFASLASLDQQQAVLAYVSAALGEAVTLEQAQAWLDYGRGVDAPHVWTVDPIDGTKGFIRGDQFAVAVALLVDGQVTVGAMACPTLPFTEGGQGGSVATAVRGQGAWIEPLDGSAPARPLRVSDRTEPAAMRAVESFERAHTDMGVSAQVLSACGVLGEPVRSDSQAKYVIVADGRAEIYIRTVNKPGFRERIWDHAAGMLIIEEAGGRVTDLDGRPLDFAQGKLLAANSGVLGSSGPLHEALVRAAAEIGGYR